MSHRTTDDKAFDAVFAHIKTVDDEATKVALIRLFNIAARARRGESYQEVSA